MNLLELANEERALQKQKYTARPLTDAEREAISAAFAAKVGKKSLRIENIVDSNLLGGISFALEIVYMTAVLRGKLDRLERKLLS